MVRFGKLPEPVAYLAEDPLVYIAKTRNFLKIRILIFLAFISYIFSGYTSTLDIYILPVLFAITFLFIWDEFVIISEKKEALEVAVHIGWYYYLQSTTISIPYQNLGMELRITKGGPKDPAAVVFYQITGSDNWTEFAIQKFILKTTQQALDDIREIAKVLNIKYIERRRFNGND